MFLVEYQERVFQVWAYSVGMSRLLLRSPKGATFDTRVDVLFQGVRSMKLPTTLRGLRISLADGLQQAKITQDTGLIADDDTRFFVLVGTSYEGYVVAAVCVEAEDDGEYHDPSEVWLDR